ncbi:MAG: cupin domain-containing protein [Ferruginibacter sp.]|nr:cupin domain-containing protein [Ferruginibacter sp.]
MKKDTTKKLFIEDADLVAEDLGEGVCRKIIAYDDRLMLVKVIFEKGATGKVHQHYHTQISYIEKGVFEVTINEEKKVLAAGGSFYVPPDAPHGVLCLEAGVLIDMFSPLREDFIPG